MSIDYAFEKCSEILKRELTDEEIFLVGLAYNLGFGHGVKKGLKDGEK